MVRDVGGHYVRHDRCPREINPFWTRDTSLKALKYDDVRAFTTPRRRTRTRGFNLAVDVLHARRLTAIAEVPRSNGILWHT